MKHVLLSISMIGMILLSARFGLAQVDAPAPQVGLSQGCAEQSSTPSESSAPCGDIPVRTMALRDQTGQTIAERLSGNQFLLTLGTLGGYDSAFDARPNLSGHFAGGRMFLGALLDRSSSFALVENSATVIDYKNGPGSMQYLDIFALSAAGSFSPSVATVLDVANTYGNDAIRIIAPQDYVDGSELGSYGIHSGRVLDNQIASRVIVQATSTRQWTISARNNFRKFFDSTQWSNTVHGGAALRLQPSERTTWGFYEDTSNESGATDCTTEGGGLLYQHKLSRVVSIDASAGPAFGTKGCFITATGTFYGALSLQPWEPTILYVTASRKLNESSFTGAVFENAVMAGVIHKLNLQTLMKVQGAWVQGRMPSNVTNAEGGYVAGLFEKEVGGGFTFSAAAQHYWWSGVTNITPSRTLVIATLSWSPMRRKPNNMKQPQIP
jgi:hypothetical protein